MFLVRPSCWARMHFGPDLRGRLFVRRPVHQPQVDGVDAELGQALLDGLALAAGVFRGELGGDEDRVAVQVGGGQRLTDAGLVAVAGGGVDVAITGLEGDGRRLGRIRIFDLPGSEAQQRHPCRAKGNRWLGVVGRGHLSIQPTDVDPCYPGPETDRIRAPETSRHPRDFVFDDNFLSERQLKASKVP